MHHRSSRDFLNSCVDDIHYVTTRPQLPQQGNCQTPSYITSRRQNKSRSQLPSEICRTKSSRTWSSPVLLIAIFLTKYTIFSLQHLIYFFSICRFIWIFILWLQWTLHTTLNVSDWMGFCSDRLGRRCFVPGRFQSKEVVLKWPQQR